MTKFLFLLILFVSVSLSGACYSNDDCHQGRSCVDKICLFDEEIYLRNTMQDTLKYFFNSLKDKKYKGFFLSEEEFLKFDTDLSYDLYMVKMEGQVSSFLLNGEETFVSVSAGIPYIITDVNGEKYPAYKDTSIIYEGKTGSEKLRIFSIVNINGRWAIFKVIDI